jgi:hypothetical protein
MRYAEIILEATQDDIWDTIRRLRELSSARITVDEQTFNIWLDFTLDDINGTIRLKIRPDAYVRKEKRIYNRDVDQQQRAFEDKIIAVVRSQRGGRPLPYPRFTHALKYLKDYSRIGANAIKILTNLDDWEVVSLLHGELEHPLGYHRGKSNPPSMHNRENHPRKTEGPMTALRKQHELD